jgi:phenylacetic acid degradation operon negative regulatory protein
MKSSIKILVLLSDQKGMSPNLIEEVVKISLDQPKSKTRTDLTELKEAGAVENDGELVKITGNGLKRLPRARGKLEYNLPYWLRSWSLLMFEIPESEKNKRDKLRYRLKKYGFGMVQSSIWISPREIPNQIESFIEDKNLQPKVQTLNFSVDKSDIKDLISQAWQINKLNEKYKQFVEEAKERFKLVREYKFDDGEIKKKALKMLAEDFKQRYHQLRKDDPKLPKSVLPSDWQGFRAHHIYEQLFKYL